MIALVDRPHARSLVRALDDDLLERARSLTGLKEKTAMVHAGLEALIARESARRLAALGGSERDLRRAPRRRRTSSPAATSAFSIWNSPTSGSLIACLRPRCSIVRYEMQRRAST